MSELVRLNLRTLINIYLKSHTLNILLAANDNDGPENKITEIRIVGTKNKDIKRCCFKTFLYFENDTLKLDLYTSQPFVNLS